MIINPNDLIGVHVKKINSFPWQYKIEKYDTNNKNTNKKGKQIIQILIKLNDVFVCDNGPQSTLSH